MNIGLGFGYWYTINNPTFEIHTFIALSVAHAPSKRCKSLRSVGVPLSLVPNANVQLKFSIYGPEGLNVKWTCIRF